MYMKSAIILLWAAVSYGLFLLTDEWWEHTIVAMSLGFALAGIGFNIQHDGNHNAYSDSRLINRLAGAALDVLGGSSYVWRWRHNRVHHVYPNIVGADEDIDFEPIARVAVGQPRYAIQRFQHLYLWFLYALLPIKWHFIDDWRNLLTGRIGRHRFPRPRRMDLAVLLLGKIFFVGLALLLPLYRHSFSVVVMFYLMTSAILGLTLSVVIQLGHCVDGTEFVTLDNNLRQIADEWALHQVRSTADFARHSTLLTWYVGGLNFQIEHHLFPMICHVHYPNLAPVVEEVCRSFGVRYLTHESFWRALAAHGSLLKRYGLATEA